MSDLETFLRGHRDDAGWRAAFADWTADRPDIARSKVYGHHWRDPKPPQLAARWRAAGLHRRSDYRDRCNPVYGGPPGWGAINAFLGSGGYGSSTGLRIEGVRGGVTGWYDHGGWTVALGIPAIVGEPYFAQEWLESAASSLQAVFPWPVSYHLDSHHNSGSCYRFAVWYTFDAQCTRREPGCALCALEEQLTEDTPADARLRRWEGDYYFLSDGRFRRTRQRDLTALGVSREAVRRWWTSECFLRRENATVCHRHEP